MNINDKSSLERSAGDHLLARSMEIEELICEGSFARSIQRLMDFAKDFGNSSADLHEAVTLSARYSALTAESRRGEISAEEFNQKTMETIFRVLELTSSITDDLDRSSK